MPRPAALTLLLALAAASPARADDAGLVRTANKLFAGLRDETLPNGLRVLLLPVPGAPVVTVNVAYRVGSADEDPAVTGLSHYLEHLLFKGTDKLKPGDIDRLTQRNGGVNNAYTSEDITNYHFDFAADRWEAALEIEADRMRNTRVDARHEFEQEKGAVVAELKGNEDRPWELEQKAILPLLFPKGSPYAHPVIGEEAHVRGATAEVITRYYDTWYHPNNATLVVAGGFDADQALARIKALFGPIPKGELPARKPAPAAKPREKLVRLEMPSKFDVARLTCGFNTIPAGHPDDYVLDVISSLLAGGRTTRLYQSLVEGEELANDVGAGNYCGRYPGWFGFDVEMLQGKSRAKAEAVLFAELDRLAREPVGDAEMKRVRRGLLASFIFSRESVHSLADFLASSSARSSPDYALTYLEKVLAVTPADVQRVAKEYFARDKAVLVWSIPEEEKKNAAAPRMERIERAAGGASVFASPLVGEAGSRQRTGWGESLSDGAGSTPHPDRSDGPTSPTRGEAKTWPYPGRALRGLARHRADAPAGGAAMPKLTAATRAVLPNGLTLLMLPNRRLPVVVAEAYVAGVRLREPAAKSGVAALLGECLEEGSKEYSGDEVATLIEDAGGALSFASAGGSVKVLAPDAPLGLKLLLGCLQAPRLPKEGVDRKRAQLLSVIADVETQPQNRARRLLMAQIYGDHPYGRPETGSRAVVEKLTPDDLRAFHAAAFAPEQTTLAVVGDFDVAEMQKLVGSLTADWKKAGLPDVKPPAPPATKRGLTVTTDPTAAQTHVYLGHLGVTRRDPDYTTLLVLDHVLGTGSGFTDRLSSNLRDRQGLAYTVTAGVSGSAGDEPGVFLGYIGTFPDKLLWVRDGFLKEIERLRAEPPTEQEVEDVKKYLLGTLAFKVATNAQLAGQLLTAERYGLGLDFLDKYRSAVGAVTPAMVQAAARKHLRPEELGVQAVGAVDKEGNALPGAKKGK